MFNKMATVAGPAPQQGLIYFTCVNYSIQPPEIQQKILNTCISAGGEHYKALFDMVTTGKSATKISLKYYISEPTAYRLKTKFFNEWEF